MGFSIRNYPLVTISGLLVILLYCVFTMVSWAFYPAPFGPSNHYLSRLGNFNYSPFGAYFYNWGCILTGLALVPFFIGLKIWQIENPIQRIIMVIGQVLGVASGFGLLAIGVFSEDQGAPHMTASSTFFTIIFFVLILITIALMLNSRFNKIVGVYGFGITLSSLAFALTVGGPLTEWYTVFGALLFVGLIAIDSMKLKNSHQL
ncbi:MAG: DUF998 domain-containing protein [Candidatus Thorarchaeota archaeon]|nr:DUF998 domain-containing protein [Candidatus Thorarchaeota archaeon]